MKHERLPCVVIKTRDYRLRGNDIGELKRLSCENNETRDYRLRGNDVEELKRLSCGGRKLMELKREVEVCKAMKKGTRYIFPTKTMKQEIIASAKMTLWNSNVFTAKGRKPMKLKREVAVCTAMTKGTRFVFRAKSMEQEIAGYAVMTLGNSNVFPAEAGNSFEILKGFQYWD